MIAPGVVGQNRGGVTTFEHLTRDRLSPSAGEQAMTQPVAVYPKIAFPECFHRLNLDIIACHQFRTLFCCRVPLPRYLI